MTVQDASRTAEHALHSAWRAERTAVLATVARRLGDLEKAEDAVQEAFAAAAARWPLHGIPDRPGAWLTTIAWRKAVDALRRDRLPVISQISAAGGHDESVLLRHRPDDAPVDPDLQDNVLSLILACCHPALSSEAKVALTLRHVVGMTDRQIASRFLVPEPTMTKRLVRARAKIRDARITFELPDRTRIAERIPEVHTVIYLIFTEGYLAGDDGPSVRRRPLRRGHLARPTTAPARSGRCGDGRPARAAVTAPCAGRCPAGRAGSTDSVRRAGPCALGRRRHRTGEAHSWPPPGALPQGSTSCRPPSRCCTALPLRVTPSIGRASPICTALSPGCNPRSLSTSTAQSRSDAPSVHARAWPSYAALSAIHGWPTIRPYTRRTPTSSNDRATRPRQLPPGRRQPSAAPTLVSVNGSSSGPWASPGAEPSGSSVEVISDATGPRRTCSATESGRRQSCGCDGQGGSGARVPSGAM